MPNEFGQNGGGVPQSGGRVSEPKRLRAPIVEVAARGDVDPSPDDGWGLPAARELERHIGIRATRAALRAKALRLARQGDDKAASQVFESLARLAHESKSDLREALEAAVRAIELDSDSPLRPELGRWLAECGQWRKAVELLLSGDPKHLDGASRRRIALYASRGGDAGTAALQLTEVARTEPDVTDVLASIGILAQWAPDQVSRERGILGWHEAARRHRARGGLLPSFEAAMRAFELDRGSPLATERLAKELDAQGRHEAADEVWRQSAEVSGDMTVHDVRATSALQQGNVVAAFAALLDGRADTRFEESAVLQGIEQLLSSRGGSSRGFDAVLSELGCADWLAVRLELGPLLERWSDESLVGATLGRVETTYFGRLEQAREAFVRAIVAQPAQPEARARLTSLGQDRDGSDPLLRALTQAARTAQDGVIARQLAAELAERCVRESGPPALALWAVERLRLSFFRGDAREPLLHRWREAAVVQAQEAARLSEVLGTATGEQEEQLLRQLEAYYAYEPSRAIEHLATVHRLVQKCPHDPTVASRFVELLDVVAGLVISPSRDERLAAALDAAPRLLGERGCIAKARFFLRHGQSDAALSVLRSLLDEPTTTVRGLLWLFVLARRRRDLVLSARAAERLAPSFRPAVRAVIEALAAQSYLEVGERVEAERLVYGALRTNQNLARLATLQVALAEHREPPTRLDSLERALSRVMPTAAMCRTLAKSHLSAGEPEMAYVWAQRALSLRPGDIDLRREILGLSLQLGEVERVVEQLEDLLRLPLPVSSWEDLAASALAWVGGVSASRGKNLARQLLDAAGASNRSLRAAMLDVARLADDGELAIEVLERAIASTDSVQERAELELAVAERHIRRGDVEACLRSVVGAFRDGAAPDGWMNYLSLADERESGDSMLLRLELRHRSALRGPEPDKLERATSAFAVGRFDLAQDTDGAVALWTEMAGRAGGAPVVAREMSSVLGPRAAVSRLEAMAKLGVSSLPSEQLLVLAALLSDEAGEPEKAAELLEVALEKVPSCVLALPVAERLLGNDVERLETCYHRVEAGVLGRFGSRALHFRAAKVLARAGRVGPALGHAVASFEALPEYEASFRLLVELSRRAGDPSALATAVMHIAETDSNRAKAARWLVRGYEALGGDLESLRLKFDFAVRSLVGTPSVRAVEAVTVCLRELAVLNVEELEFLRHRFVRALESLTGELEGPDGARLGIAIARIAAKELGRTDVGNAALLAALKADADVDEFDSLQAFLLAAIRADRSAFSLTLQTALEWLESPYVAIGRPAIEMLAMMAALLVDAPQLLRLEQRTVRLGHSPWLVGWLSAEDGTVWNDVEDALALAVALAHVFLERDEVDVAASVLERGAQSRGVVDAGEGGAASTDAGWQDWQLAYTSCVVRLAPVAGLREARARLGGLEGTVPLVTIAGLRVALERVGGDERALSKALAELAFLGTGSSRARAELLVEAAQIAERLGDMEGAVVYYRASAEAARGFAPARWGLATALYRQGRYGAREQAELAFESMRELDGSVAEEERDLLAYLRAEALDSLGDEDQARAVLVEAESQLGPRTFVVLGLAERASREGDASAALGYFAAALGGGLRQIRQKSEVALSAARAAAACGDVALALSWLEPGLTDPQTRPEAATLEAELLGAKEADDEARAAAEASESTSPGAIAPLSGAVPSRDPEVSPDDAAETRVVEVDDRTEVSRPDVSVPLPFEEPLPDSARPEAYWTSHPESHRYQGELEEGSPEDSNVDWSSPEAVAPAQVPGANPNAVAEGTAERELNSVATPIQIAEPSVYEFALAVAEELHGDPARQRAWLGDGRRWLRQWPAQLRLVELVRDAAEAEGHGSHVRALEQVAAVLRGDEVLASSPELSEQAVDVDAVRALLLRELLTPGTEALELVWDGAEREFQREPSEYEVTGLMRVVGSASPMSRIYTEAARHFGMSRAPLFHRRNAPERRISILLLSPTAVLIEGEPTSDERTLGYRLGSALWATLPAHSLLFGLGEDSVRQVLRALGLAFGAGSGQPNPTYGESLRLAQVLWQTVRSRSQRRLKEICRTELDYGQSLRLASQSLRRAGLYVSGDLRTAVASWCEDAGTEDVSREPSRLVALAVASPDVLDLFRFATSAEYADVRWQVGRAAPPVPGGRQW